MSDYLSSYDTGELGFSSNSSGGGLTDQEATNLMDNNLLPADMQTPAGGIDLSKVNWGNLLAKYGPAAVGTFLGASGALSSTPQKSGYQGKIPSLTATRQQLPIDYNAPRRPGSGGRRYFTDMVYAPKGGIASIAPTAPAASSATPTTTSNTTPATTTTTTSPAISSVYDYANNQPTRPSNPTSGSPEFNIPSNVPVDPKSGLAEIQQQYANQGYTDYIPTATNTESGAAHGGLISGYAQGGIANLGYYLGGQTDGMADKIPANIDQKQQAKLSHGEFVVPADIVSALGSGNSSAGAKVLYDMMDRIRKHAHGTTKQIRPANLKKTLPA